MRIDDESARSSRTRNARNRANPMGSRPARNAGGRSAGGAPNDEAGKAVGAAIRGVAQGGKQGGGRVPGGGGDLPKTNNTIQVLKRFLGSRWNAEAKFLNLEVSWHRQCRTIIQSTCADRIKIRLARQTSLTSLPPAHPCYWLCRTCKKTRFWPNKASNLQG